MENIIFYKESEELKENYERIYNENCILREKHNINDIGLLDENYKLKQVIDKAIEYIHSTEYQYGDLEQDVYDYDIGFDEVEELLKILRGETNDN